MPSSFELTIRPHRGWQPIDIREIWLYRELLVFLVWRAGQAVISGWWRLVPAVRRDGDRCCG